MLQHGMVALLKGASKRWGGSSAAERSIPLPYMCNLSRAFSSKLFVGGLAYHTTEEMLRKAFAEHGEVVDVRIITDRETGRSRGFGFITFSSEADAEAAKVKMSNHLLDGRYIRVDLASTRPPQSPASPPPYGNSASSSSSGFSFGTPGTRPPPVEDWGPLPFYGTNATQTTSSQGSFESSPCAPAPGSSPNEGSADTIVNGGISPTNSTFDANSSPSSSNVQQAASATSNTFISQSSSSALEVRSSSFDMAASSNATYVSAQQTTVFSGASAPQPNILSPASTQGMTINNSTVNTVPSFEASTGQSFPTRSSSEAGTAPAQTAKARQENNGNFASRTGFKSFGERSGGGRPPSVLNLGSATYDFRNFPEFDASTLKNSKSSSEMEEPKKGVLSHRNKLAPKKAETWESKLTEEAIPPAKGPTFDFGLCGIPDAPPPSDAGSNPHGGLSLNVNLDELPEAEPVRLPYSIFTARTLPRLDLPWLTPEADNWSEIGKPPRRIEDSPYSPFSPDLKDDPEFWWDPYDFDPEAKLLKEAVAEVPAAEVNTTKETEGEAKIHEQPEAEAKVVKEPEADEVPAANVAAS